MENSIDLKNIVSMSNIVFNSNAKSKHEVLVELSKVLFANDILSDRDKFLTDVYMREAEGLTGIGNGIAIPHGKSKFVNQTTIAIALLDEGIEWESLDEEPVKVVFLFAVKEEDSSNKHLLMLQKIAIKIANNDFVEDLKRAGDKKQIYQLLCE